MKIAIRFSGLLITLLLSISPISCGGGGGGDTGTTAQDAIEIETPVSEDTTSSDCNEIYLGGEADYPASKWSNVRISWENQTASGGYQGAGQASVGNCLGWFLGYTWDYACDAGWWAEVPLEVGDNKIKITAVETLGSNETVIGQDTITVNKPVMSYSIKGRITNVDDIALFNMKVTIEGADGFTYTDANGDYELKCLRSGTYRVMPDPNGYYNPDYAFTNYMDWPFTPGSSMVTINDHEVASQDFSAEVYEVSGMFTTISGYGFQGVDVVITGTDGKSSSSRTDENGFYSFMVPSGTFIIQPSTSYSFNPPSRSVEVEVAGVYDQDFSAQ
jgi:hypothetical protein